LLAGGFSFNAARKTFSTEWGAAQEIIEEQIKREVKL
jgi:hypothetical protein